MARLAGGPVALAIPLIVLAAAGAGAGLKTKSASTILTSSNEFESVNVGCGRGATVVSGGFAGSGSESGAQSQVLVIDSARTNRRKWTSAGAYYLGAPSGDFKAYSYCDDSKPRLTTRSGSTTIGQTGSPDAIGSAIARCPRATEAVSGGFDAPDFAGYVGAAIFPIESQRVGKRRWRVSGFNFGGASGELTAYAYCDRTKPGLEERSRSKAAPGFPEQTFVTARCGRKSRAVSGGFDSPDFEPSGTESEVYPYVSRRLGRRRWTVGSFNESSQTTLRIVAFAYCERR